MKKQKSLSDTLIPYMPQTDKLYHDFLGSCFAVLGLFFDIIFMPPFLCAFSLSAAFAAGLYKEWYDKYISKTSKWCWLDIAWTMKTAIIIQIAVLCKYLFNI